MIDDDFDSIASTMTDGIDTAKQGLQIIDQVQTALPEIQQLGTKQQTLPQRRKKVPNSYKMRYQVFLIVFK